MPRSSPGSESRRRWSTIREGYERALDDGVVLLRMHRLAWIGTQVQGGVLALMRDSLVGRSEGEGKRRRWEGGVKGIIVLWVFRGWELNLIIFGYL